MAEVRKHHAIAVLAPACSRCAGEMRGIGLDLDEWGCGTCAPGGYVCAPLIIVPHDPCTRCKGTGKEPRQPSRDQVVTWMAVTGWVPGAAGSAGAWWTLPGTDHVIGVANSFPGPGSIEYRSVIERLAVFAMCSPDEMGERIAAWAEAGES